MLQNLKIKNRIIAFTLFSLLVTAIGLGTISYTLSKNSIIQTLNNTLISLAEQGAKQITAETKFYKTVLEGIANRNVVRSMDWDSQQKPALQSEIDRTFYIGMGGS